jgi:hypothetical protein
MIDNLEDEVRMFEQETGREQTSMSFVTVGICRVNFVKYRERSRERAWLSIKGREIDTKGSLYKCWFDVLYIIKVSCKCLPVVSGPFIMYCRNQP